MFNQLDWIKEELDSLELTNDVIEEFRTGRHLNIVQAHQRQQLAAEVQRERRTMSMGEVAFQMDPVFYHHFGQKYGYDCWSDADFVHDTLKKNPECKVISRSDKIQVGYTPTRSKFHQSFGADWGNRNKTTNVLAS